MQILEPLSPTGAVEATIQELENELGRRLPEDYRRFLSEINGGRPNRARFTILSPEGATDSAVAWFLTLDPQESRYTISRYRTRYDDRVPAGVIPIGCDSFGNLILLDIGAREFGYIYFWDHERESMDDPYWDNIYMVSRSFDSFSQSLRD